MGPSCRRGGGDPTREGDARLSRLGARTVGHAAALSLGTCTPLRVGGTTEPAPSVTPTSDPGSEAHLPHRPPALRSSWFGQAAQTPGVTALPVGLRGEGVPGPLFPAHKRDTDVSVTGTLR